ncbi:glycoside hydrolase family 28 protein [Ereboglobus luteus]|uniref:Glycoside hydrolase n=1 Tax=Ereboglobus luteus TaxID=1796921 RepID=A0A2U8E4D6_9BACT|nr:glycoside hydrolase family 28 protein [Ereboglobus luteus]AWI09711.1 hypothetical protein CKA38_11010 [Ereboglobus luteus]
MRHHLRLLSLFILHFSLFISAALAARIDVTAHGAVGDAKTLNTAVLQKAIDTVSKSGGGTIYFPAGRFLTGALHLRDNITLHLDTGAVILASPSMKDYPNKHFLIGRDIKNIAIEGRGTIDGNGRAFYDENLKPIPRRPSPFIELWGCKNIRIENITIRNAPGWTIHPKNCDDVQIRGISLLNDITLVNTDGIDIDSSRNVIISDCRIEAGDDCIVIKTTNRVPTGEKKKAVSTEQLPCENIVVTNCILVSAASALKLGTESHADFRHIRFDNCIIRDSRTGLALMCKDGATMEDIHFSNITMTTKPKWGKGYEWPITVDLEKRTDASRLGAIRNVTFNNITLFTKGRVMVAGLPERPLENIAFNNITYRVSGYENIKGAKKVKGGNSKGAADTPEYGSTPSMFILANLKNITIDGLDLTWPAPTDATPARHIIGAENLVAPAFRNLPKEANIPGLPPLSSNNSTQPHPTS